MARRQYRRRGTRARLECARCAGWRVRVGLAGVGYLEREPGRLQSRFVLSADEHVDEILVAEDDEAVVVLATVGTPAGGDPGDRWEGPWHVYLDRPLEDRAVIDGCNGSAVPYRNVYESLFDD